MKNKKLFIIALLLGLCFLLIGCELKDHKQYEEITKEYPFEVILDFNGGKASNYEKIKYRCKSGGKISVPNDAMIPSKFGYEVSGWFVKPSEDSDVADIDTWKEWNFATDTVTKNTTLVVRWRRLRSFSFGYYDNIVPEGQTEAEKTWVELLSITKSMDGSEFVCNGISSSEYVGMNNRLTGKTLLSGFNPEQPFYSDEALTKEINVDGLVHPIVTEDDFQGDDAEWTYKIYCKYLEGNWTILDSNSRETLGNKNYYLVDDIVLRSSETTLYLPEGLEKGVYTTFNPSLRYTSTIKGNGHKIICNAPLTPIYDRQSTLFIGLFGVMDGAVIEDVTFEGFNFRLHLPSGTHASLKFGFLAGNIMNSTLKNVTVSGEVVIDNTDGNKAVRELIGADVWFGQKDPATIVEGCDFTGIVVTDNRA